MLHVSLVVELTIGMGVQMLRDMKEVKTRAGLIKHWRALYELYILEKESLGFERKIQQLFL